ncbi:MAG: GNAT family N-acetyltransferase [Vampirovibrionales bacterium]|nr:GNAT family N-acetyltransferase [Vampirovibrionales bacterium]
MSEYLASELGAIAPNRLHPPSVSVRPLCPKDNEAMRDIITASLQEFGCSGQGFSALDPEMDDLYTAYQRLGWRYWVAEDTETGQLLGGVGLYPLKGLDARYGVAEFHKFYLSPDARGKGVGKALYKAALGYAVASQYRWMYLETHPNMTQAIALYEKWGFHRLPLRMGGTGHSGFSVFMIRSLNANAPVKRSLKSISQAITAARAGLANQSLANQSITE